MNCSFCGCRIEKGTETIFVTKKGSPLYFCSSKCERNLLKLGRKPRKVRWTTAYKAEKDVRIKSVPISEPREIEETRKGKEIEEEPKDSIKGGEEMKKRLGKKTISKKVERRENENPDLNKT